MASQKQIDANRINAQKSTGPSSPEGRARSRCNAIRDGLTDQITTLSNTDRPFFEKLQSEMLSDLNPQNALERSLAIAIAWDTWRLNRLRAVETNLCTLGQQEDEDQDNTSGCGQLDHDPDDLDAALSDARTYRDEAPRLELMSLYESRMTRSLHRNITLLRDLQAERKRNYEHDKKEEVLIARICEFNDLPIKASTAPSKNGFIFSNEEIATAAVRNRYVDTAAYVIKNRNPAQLYGTLAIGFGDSLMQKAADRADSPHPEVQARGDSPHPEVQACGESPHPEVQAIDRLQNPSEYCVRTGGNNESRVSPPENAQPRP